MALSVANILLQVTGESDDARRELADVARDLALFGRETAEAEAEIDTTSASASLDELKARLAEFSADDATAEVNVQIAKALADCAALQAELDRIDGENVTVDVDVRRGVAERVGALSSQVERLGATANQTAGGGLGRLVSGFFDADIGAGRFSASLGSILEFGPPIVAVIVAIVGQLAAMVASAASAAAGVGALAVAFGAALIPGILLGIGAIARFKAESEEAGTAAFALAGNAEDLANAFTNATAGGSDALFKGISDSIRDIVPLIGKLGPAFTQLGKAGGDALRSLGKEFSSPAWAKFFEFTIDSLGKLTPLFARSFGAMAKVLANIAQAAMPFLIQGFKAVASGIEAIADKTSDIKGLRDTIGGMVDSLKAWGKLLGGIGDLTGAFVQALAPIGDGIVASLGEGAHNLADWLRSSEGLRKVKQFFEDTGPLASELGKLILGIALALLQLGQLVSPALTPIFKAFNRLVGVLNDFLSYLNDNVSNGVREFLGNLVGSFVTSITRLPQIIQGAAGAVADAVSSLAKLAVDQVRDQFARAQSVGQALIHALEAGFNAARGAVVAAARAIITHVINEVRSQVGRAGQVGRAIFNAVKAGFNEARGAVVDGARAIIRAALDTLRGAIDLAKNIGESIINAVKGGFNAARAAVIGALNDLRSAALDQLRSAVDAARAAGEALINGLANGIKSAAGAVVNAVQSIYNKIKEIVEAPLHVHIDVPHVDLPHIPGFASGVRGRASGGVAVVGESGPELSFVPQGADIFTAMETRRILRALASGITRPLAGGGAVPALAGAGGGGTTINQYVTPIAGGGSPDPEVLAAQLSARARARAG